MIGTIRRRRAATIAVLAAMAMVVLDAGVVNIALPTIANSLGVSAARSIHVVSAYQLALLIGLMPCAHAAERFGYRRLFLFGVAVFGGASLLCALTPTLPLLIAARFVQGLGGAGIMALGIPLLRLALGTDLFGKAIGWNALTVALCSAAGPAVGGLLLSEMSWQWIFIINLPVGVVAFLAGLAVPADRPTSSSIDLPSMVLYASAAALLAVATDLATRWPLLATCFAMIGVACFAGLVSREKPKHAPLIPFDLLAMPRFRISVMASICCFTAQTAGIVALTIYLQIGLGRSAASTAMVMIAWPLAVAVASTIANRSTDRYPAGSLCSVGGAILAVGLGAAAFWPIDESVLPLAGCTMICGIGFGLFQVSNNRNLFLSAPPERSAAAGGMQATARLAGQTMGALLVATLLSVASASLAPRVALGLGALFALAASIVSMRRFIPTIDIGAIQFSNCAEKRTSQCLH
jgi:DHA2 family multidrug resistance protein-like MFS transporter